MPILTNFKNNNFALHIRMTSFIPASCGGEIINIAGNIRLFGNPSGSFLDTLFCEWKVVIPYYQRTRFQFTKFSFHQSTDCANSIITISTSKLNYLFCSERKPQSQIKMEFDEKSFVIKVLNRKWSVTEGFQLEFKDAFSY